MTVSVEYDLATGRILQVVEDVISGPGVLSAQIAPDPALVYVTTDPELGAVLTSRPSTPAPPTSSAGGFTVTGLSVGAQVEVLGPIGKGPLVQSATIGSAGALSVDAPTPGTYQVTITPGFPAREVIQRVSVEAGQAPAALEVHIVMPLPLATLRAQAIARVDVAANALSELLITAGPAMNMIYLQKRQEADAVLALSDPASASPAAYPLVASEANVDGVGMDVAAATIQASAGAFTAVGAVWDQLRLEAKRDIRVATTIADIEAGEALVTRANLDARLIAAGIDPAQVLTA